MRQNKIGGTRCEMRGVSEKNEMGRNRGNLFRRWLRRTRGEKEKSLMKSAGTFFEGDRGRKC